MRQLILVLLVSAFLHCGNAGKDGQKSGSIKNLNIVQGDTSLKSIHVFVALCDNKYQGIVPVNSKIGNGQDPDNNLYWGWAYGVKSYFKKSKNWIFLASRKSTAPLLERIVYKHKTEKQYLIADAYDGQYMKNCINDFLSSLSGQAKDTIIINNNTIVGTKGNAQLVAFVGHNGLMDFKLDSAYNNYDGKERKAIILACLSKKYFSYYLRKAGAYPLLWTSNLMGPEAYTLHDAITGYINNETDENIRERAATIYSTYTKCSQKAAKGLLVTGW